MSEILQDREVNGLSDVIRGLALDGVERVLFAPHSAPETERMISYLASHGLGHSKASDVDVLWFGVACEAAEIGALIGYALAQNPPGLTDSLEKWLLTAICRAGLGDYKYPGGLTWECRNPQQEKGK